MCCQLSPIPLFPRALNGISRLVPVAKKQPALRRSMTTLFR